MIVYYARISSQSLAVGVCSEQMQCYTEASGSHTFIGKGSSYLDVWLTLVLTNVISWIPISCIEHLQERHRETTYQVDNQFFWVHYQCGTTVLVL